MRIAQSLLPEFDQEIASTRRLLERVPEDRNASELVALLDENAADAREALEGVDDETMMKEWSLRSGNQVFFTLPKVAVIRSFVMNRLIHHRGQLTGCLRQCDVPLPGIYGPSADEQ